MWESRHVMGNPVSALPREKSQVTPLQKAARTYADKYRLLVIPLEPGEKRPAFRTGPNHQTLATLEAEKIDHWWEYADYNIGLPCTPNRLAVIDVDGPEGAAHLARLEAEHGPLPTTWMQSSTRADRPSEQYVYRWPSNEMVPTRAISPQLEIRAHGAQIVVAPSKHPTGSTYQWLIPPSDMPDGPRELPAWVLGLITRPEGPTEPSQATQKPITTTDRTVAQRRFDGLVEAVATTDQGNRNKLLNHAAYTAARIPGITDTEIIRRLTAAGQTVGLDDKEVKATIQSGLTAGHRDGPDPEHHEPNPLILTSPAAATGEEPEPSSEWEPVDLHPILAGDLTHLDPPPNILRRSDGQALIYQGELNWISGEPETGKSWLAQLAAVQEIQAGNNIIFIDLEDTPGRIIDRLTHLGLTTDQIRSHFHYIRPTIGANPTDLLRLFELATRCTLAVIDGTTDLHLIHGLSPEDNQDAARLVSQLLRPLADAGPAVLPLDHVTKNKDTRGRYAIGAQHKLAAVRGASYHLETVVPMGRGAMGQASLYITKDRPGHIRGVHTLRQGLHKHRAGDFYLDATTPQVELRVAPPQEAIEYADSRHRGEIVQFVESRYMTLRRGLTANEIYQGVGGKKQDVLALIKTMGEDGDLTMLPNGKSPVYAPGTGVFNDV